MVTLRIEVSEQVAASLGASSEEQERAMEQLVTLEAYRRHDITGSEGAKALGLSLEAFLKLAGSRGIPFLDITPDELDEEFRRFGLA